MTAVVRALQPIYLVLSRANRRESKDMAARR
jgi:hypothetical protein